MSYLVIVDTPYYPQVEGPFETQGAADEVLAREVKSARNGGGYDTTIYVCQIIGEPVELVKKPMGVGLFYKNEKDNEL